MVREFKKNQSLCCCEEFTELNWNERIITKLRQLCRMWPCCNREGKVEENFFRGICHPVQCCLKLHQKGRHVLIFIESLFPGKQCGGKKPNNFKERNFDWD